MFDDEERVRQLKKKGAKGKAQRCGPPTENDGSSSRPLPNPLINQLFYELRFRTIVARIRRGVITARFLFEARQNSNKTQNICIFIRKAFQFQVEHIVTCFKAETSYSKLWLVICPQQSKRI